jgi:hypothetical protein
MNTGDTVDTGDVTPGEAKRLTRDPPEKQ